MNPRDPGSRYLCVAGVAIPQDDRHAAFVERFEALKRDHLPPPYGGDFDDPCILHREDIVARRYPHFLALRDDACNARFCAALLAAIDATPFLLYGVVLDKQTHHAATYRNVSEDYEYCILALLQRHCGRLLRFGHVGDMMAEARGGTQDRALKNAYRKLAENGGPYFGDDRRKRLTSVEIKLKQKTANVMGLQLADIVARDVMRDVLAVNGRGDPPTGFGAELLAVLEKKYARRHGVRDATGIAGYGRVLLR